MPRKVTKPVTSSPTVPPIQTKTRMNPLPSNTNITSTSTVSTINSNSEKIVVTETDETVIFDIIKKLASDSDGLTHKELKHNRDLMRLCAMIGHYANFLVIDHGIIPNIYHPYEDQDPISPADDQFHFINRSVDGIRGNMPWDNTEKVIKVITFPIHRYNENEAKIEFDDPVTKWEAIKAVEEYFNRECTDLDWELGKIDWRKDLVKPKFRFEVLGQLIFLESIDKTDTPGHFELSLGS